MIVNLSARAIDERLREASRLAGALRPETRLDAKLDMTAAGVTARLKAASDLLELCRTLAGARPDQNDHDTPTRAERP